jgi:hypothetical protein
VPHHEPILLDEDDWTKSHALVQYNLNRVVNNIHEERDRINGLLLDMANHAAEQREKDLLRISDRYDPIFARLSSAEARAAIFGAVAGVVSSGIITLIVALFVKKVL